MKNKFDFLSYRAVAAQRINSVIAFFVPSYSFLCPIPLIMYKNKIRRAKKSATKSSIILLNE